MKRARIITIEKKHLENIKFVRNLIEHNNKYQDMLVDRIAERIGLKTKGDKETLWDYVYNESDWMVTIVDDAK